MIWTSDKLLTAIRDERACDCITIEHMVKITGLGVRQVTDAAFKLCKHKLLEKSADGCYSMTDAGRVALESGKAIVRSGPKGQWQSGRRVVANTLRDRAWRAMRIRRKFTVADLASLAVDGSERGDPTSNLQKYVKALHLAGYLVLLPRREPCISPTSPGYKRWWLTDEKDTGPKAPVWHTRAKKVYDQNTETEIDISAPLPNPLPQTGEGTKAGGAA